MNALTRDLAKLVETAEQSQKTREELSVSDRKFREKLHLMPPVGWLNDPNGLCQFQGIYHAFFQYSPFDVEGGVKMWGHYTSTNMIDWEYQVPHFIRISRLTVTGYIPDPHLSKMEKCICTIQEMSN